VDIIFIVLTLVLLTLTLALTYLCAKLLEGRA
jgi:hypothetical protein